ncbi:MAG: hypothetical protein A2Y25_00875 [Candidatus Melainabacteria bacterium GWF2_37_15]|nr:MAG: hypothetical protein A2Y25_00875 [Candidatus Melainabacteria bacterium GWF2_37_15]
MSILNREFYKKNTLDVAKNLLGCKIFRKINNEILSGTIVETEAYMQDDPACHAFNGYTQRSATLFKQAGIAYVYLIYGMYYCLNFVTEAEGTAGAVLIRALNMPNANGPGKLCRELKIDKSLNEADVTNKKSGLWVEKGITVPPENIVTTTRIGIKKAADYPWRFYIKDNKFVSKL